MQKAEEREKFNIHRNVFKMIVYFHIEKHLKQEEYRKNMKIELNKLDNKNIDIENENDSSKNDDENNFRHSKNNTFLKSDESEYKNKDYTDDETDDKKNSDDES